MEITVKTEESAQSAACADAGAACSMTGTYESAGERETFELGMRFGKAAFLVGVLSWLPLLGSNQ